MGVTENRLKLEQGTSNLLQKRCVYTFTDLLSVCQLAACRLRAVGLRLLKLSRLTYYLRPRAAV